MAFCCQIQPATRIAEDASAMVRKLPACAPDRDNRPVLSARFIEPALVSGFFLLSKTVTARPTRPGRAPFRLVRSLTDNRTKLN